MTLIVQKVDGTIHRMNHCPAHKHKQNQLSYLVDSSYVQHLTNNWGHQAPVVQTIDSAVHRINYYPADKH